MHDFFCLYCDANVEQLSEESLELPQLCSECGHTTVVDRETFAEVKRRLEPLPFDESLVSLGAGEVEMMQVLRIQLALAEVPSAAISVGTTLYMHSPRYIIYVDPDDEATAVEVFERFAEAEGLLADPDEAEGDLTCPACGTPVPENADTCPECELTFAKPDPDEEI